MGQQIKRISEVVGKALTLIKQQLSKLRDFFGGWIPLVLPPFFVACMLIGNIALVLIISGETKTVNLLNNLAVFVEESLIFIAYFEAIVIIFLSFLFLTSPNTWASRIFSWVAEKSAHSVIHYVAIVFGLFPAIMLGIFVSIKFDAIDKQIGWTAIIAFSGMLLLVSVLGSMSNKKVIDDLIVRITKKEVHRLVRPIVESNPKLFNGVFFLCGVILLVAPTLIAITAEEVKVKVPLSIAEYDEIAKVSESEGKTVEQFVKKVVQDSLGDLTAEQVQ